VPACWASGHMSAARPGWAAPGPSAEVCSPLSEAVYVLTAPAAPRARLCTGHQGITCKAPHRGRFGIHTGAERDHIRQALNLLDRQAGHNFARPTGCQPGANGLATTEECYGQGASAVPCRARPSPVQLAMEPAVAVDDALDSPRSPVRGILRCCSPASDDPSTSLRALSWTQLPLSMYQSFSRLHRPAQRRADSL
jgi:hypothetical protein